jgi:hypothetical protein
MPSSADNGHRAIIHMLGRDGRSWRRSVRPGKISDGTAVPSCRTGWLKLLLPISNVRARLNIPSRRKMHKSNNITPCVYIRSTDIQPILSRFVMFKLHLSRSHMKCMMKLNISDRSFNATKHLKQSMNMRLLTRLRMIHDFLDNPPLTASVLVLAEQLISCGYERFAQTCR